MIALELVKLAVLIGQRSEPFAAQQLYNLS
jgi:hypothetical protein